MFYYSILNASGDVLNKFYERFMREVNNLVESAREKPEYETLLDRGIKSIDAWADDFTVELMPSNVDLRYRGLHSVLIQAIRISALLHDIGHPPFSHVIENSLKDVYNECKSGSPSDRKNTFVSRMERYFEDDDPHEIIGQEITSAIFNKIILDFRGRNKYEHEKAEKFFILKEVVLAIQKDDPYFDQLHAIIDGTLDGDRLDYVTRDPLNSGMNAGRIDYDRIIIDMKLLNDGDRFVFCLPIKAVNAVEDFLKRRFDMYKNIVYHHRVVKTDCLMENSVSHLIRDYLNEDKTIETSCCDKDDTLLPYNISGLWYILNELTTSEKNHALSQWNDSWLMVVLKQEYYKNYYLNDKVGSEIYNQLSELIENRKTYKTIIKRIEDFKIIDDGAKQVFQERKDEFLNLMKELKNASDNHNWDSSKNNCDGITVDQSLYLEKLEQILSGQIKGFVISFILKYPNLFASEDVKGYIKKHIQEKYASLNPLVVFKKIKTGITCRPVYFYDSKGEIMYLDSVSGIQDVLEQEVLARPVFYMYIIEPKEGGVDCSRLLKEIGLDFGNYFYETNKKRIEEQLCSLTQ